MRGWRAADSGAQTIRLIFDQPQRLNRISLAFEETVTERTQEFVLRWSRSLVSRNCAPAVEFSPPNSIHEDEEYQDELSGFTVLELVIVPDISRGAARASLRSLRVS